MTATGTIFEGFRLLRPLGKGWLGQVFAAQNLDGAQVQALRIIAPELVAQPQVMTQFRRLFAKWQRLSHPNVLTPNDLIEREQHVLYSMALAQSGSVRQLLQSQAREGQFLDLLVAVDIARQVAGALAYAHEQNLMHGNLKPENLLLTPARALLGRQAYGVLVSDFGVGELQAFTHGVHDRQIITTPAYMSPEQCRGIRTEVRSDIYTLGIILYELLTNLVPFETKEFAEAMDKHLHVAPIPPGQIRLDIPSDLEEIVLTCMAKTPEYRYRTARELEEALQRVINGLLPQGPRPTVVLPDIPEPGAPRIEPLRDRVPFPRLQVCDANGQLIRVEVLKNDSATVGRAPNNTIVLEHAGVSRHHLTLDLAKEDDESAVYVTDLGSTNGTTLGGVALLPRERTLWPDGRVLRVEPFWLRLQPPQRVVQQARIGVLVEDNDIQLIPGEAVTLKVNLANTGKTVDHFRLEVEGVPENWVHNLYHELQLNPGTTGETTLKLLVPREFAAHAGVYPVKVIARSRENPAEFGFAPMKWDVQPFVDTKTEFSPLRRSAWRRTHYDLKLINTSNLPITYRPTIADDEGEVRLQSPLEQIQVPAAASSGNLSSLLPIRAILLNTWLRLREGIGKVTVKGLPDSVTLQPGESYSGRINVRLPIRWIAAPKSRSLHLHPNPEVGPDYPAKLSLLHLPLIPLWALPLALLLGFLLLMWLMQAPSIVSVTVDPQRPLVGQPFTLKFETRNTTRLHVSPFDKTLFAKSGTLLIPQGIKEPTDIQVVAYGRIKTTQQSFTISPKLPDPVIRLFSVTPTNITAGQRATVRWDVANVKEVTISPLGTLPARGEKQVTVTQDTDFSLKGGSGDQAVDKTIPVKVLPAQIEIFEVTPEQADIGQQVTIHWKVQNAESVTIDPIGTVGNSGQIKKVMSGEQAYTIKVQVGSQTLTRTVQVKVNPPVIDAFTVTPESAQTGDQVSVSWKVSHATNVAIDPLGPVGASGRQAVTVSGPMTIHLTASNGQTNVEASKTVNVTARPPTIGGVSISPRRPRAGQQVTLTWDAKDAQSVELGGLPSGPMTLPPSGSQPITAPDNTANLTLVAKGADGTTTSKSIVLQVIPAAIVGGGGNGGSGNGGGGGPTTGGGGGATTVKPQVNIGSFGTDKSTIAAGQSANLNWKVTGTDEVKIYPPGNPLGASGSLTVSPRETTTYTLVAGDQKARVTVTVKAAPAPQAKIVSFAADQATLTAGQSTTLRWKVTGAAQVRLTPPGAAQPASGSLTVRPAQTTTYTISGGGQQESVTVTVNRPPQVRILNFSASKTSITAGQSVTLRWKVTGAQDVSMNPPLPGNMAPSGTATVSPSETTTYTLRADGKQAQVTVTVRPRPAQPQARIGSFSADRTSITAGQAVTLRWVTSGAQTVSITPPGNAVPSSGSLSLSPTETTTYTLQADGKQAQVTVNVTPRPQPPQVKIINFTADKAAITAGQSLTLRWNVTGTPEVKVFPPGSAYPASGSVAVTPTQTTTYTLRAGDQSQTVQVTVNPAQSVTPVVIQSFTAINTKLNPGEATTLLWKVSGVPTVRIMPLGVVKQAQSLLTVRPTKTTTYTLIAGNQSQTVTVTVSAPAPTAKPKIVNFSASPGSIKPGESATLSWKVTGAAQVRITPPGAAQPASGSLTVRPAQTTTYSLTAGSQTQTVTVTVTAPQPPAQPKIVSFSANHDVITAGQVVILKWKVTGAKQVQIQPGGSTSSAENVLSVKPTQTTTYTLVAGNQSQSVTVTVTSPVQILNFSARPASITAGESATLSWKASGVSSVQILPLGAQSTPENTLVVKPTQTTTYTLVADGKRQQVTVTVNPQQQTVVQPRIVSFSADRTSIKPGETVTLSWKALGVAQVRILPSNSLSTPENVLSVKPQQTTTYTLVAGDKNQSLTVTVTPPSSPPTNPGAGTDDTVMPVIVTFQASETEVAPDTQITLTWQTQAAKSVILQGKIMKPNDQITRVIKKDTTFTLIAINGNQKVQRTLTVRVKQ